MILVVIGIFGCDDIVELEDISRDAVTLIAPYNNAVLHTATLNFTWEPVVDAENYQIQIAAPNFENPLQIVVDSTITTHNLLIDLESNSYEWRVKAKNSGYETLYTQQAFTIEIEE